MSARAQERIRAEQERERERIAEEMAAERAEMEERYRLVREAGPPGGCHECWHWVTHYSGHTWWHGESVQPGPPPDDLEPGSMLLDPPTRPADWCWHPCHEGHPMFCGLIAWAAC